MSIHRLLAYHVRVFNTLHTLEETQRQTIKRQAEHVKKLFAQMSRHLHYQALTTLGFSGLAGAVTIGGLHAQAGPNSPFSIMGQLINTVGGGINQAIDNTKKSAEFEMQRVRDDDLQFAKEARRNSSDSFDKIDNHVSSLQKTIAEAMTSAARA